ncbi:uncharacterized protein BP5553_00659 [Venustampulla echinocandica]|uniref:Uncharacterized protein n=1 Tax=Venustampulla echinocandica TaxID=2656787 RepID=A0A370TYU5_9HELO|nr:uncharacterized protein BP5553_00659 [Venustampulla echinocandica]RDL40680.1 hypothetical protein BP5553_00659 [Venustampulla echinocandica]
MDQSLANNFCTFRLSTPIFVSDSDPDHSFVPMDSKETPAAMANPSSPSTIDAPGNPNARINKNGPQDQFQITRHLLYERDFGGDAYVSAHLQRLQNGCFTDKNMHEPDMLHVTFAAITFTFHPSLSDVHRFRSAVITITANSSPDGNPIKFLKFAPHLAFGRISSASLKWYFQLAATVGVTRGLSEASLKPSLGYEKDMVVGSMVKIQGSTRSTTPYEPFISISSSSQSPSKARKKLPDTRLVWSLEENPQQESGLPREFTFVFLMERLHSDQKETIKRSFAGNVDGSCLSAPPAVIKKKQLSTSTKPVTEAEHKSNTRPTMCQKAAAPVPVLAANIVVQEEQEVLFDGHGKPYLPPTSVQYTAVIESSGEQSFDGIKETIARVPHVRLRSSEEETPIYFKKADPKTKELDGDYDDVFTPIHFNIAIQPRINGSLESKIFGYDSQRSIVSGEVGQVFPTSLAGEGASAEEHHHCLINGLYNFAKLPGSFEDLVGLPGNSFSTVEPSL